MSIVFSAIVPHSPLLIPMIGKENQARLTATINAYKRLEEDLYASQPELIIIISPHGKGHSNAFTMNHSPKFTCSFEDFGDFTTKMEFVGDIGHGYKIREKMETSAPLQLASISKLDHGSSIPLYLLASHLPKVKIIPIYYSGLDMEAHYKFGQQLKNELLSHKVRVALVASGDLSHRLTKDAPAGFSPKAKKFDKKVIDYILNCETKDLLDIDKDLISEVSECGLKSIAIFLGVMDGIRYSPYLLSYEYPFGVGYMTMGFRL